MDRQPIRHIFLIGLALFIVSCSPNQESYNPGKELNLNSTKELSSLFKEPPNQYRSAPLWVWNDVVSEEQIDQQLNDFKFCKLISLSVIFTD